MSKECGWLKEKRKGEKGDKRFLIMSKIIYFFLREM